MKGIAQMTKEWKIYVNVTFNEDVNVKHDTALSRSPIQRAYDKIQILLSTGRTKKET